jgi:formylmethanofuran dehydrogenase subunit E
MRLGTYTFEEYTELAKNFHGYKAPGIILGGFMVEMARTKLPRDILYDAISETTHCLPDSIQLLTPCTLGNGWLKVINLGRYALCLYDKFKGNGVRVYVDPDKLNGWEHIQNWYLKLIPKKEQDTTALLNQISQAGKEICGWQQVCVSENYLKDNRRGNMSICPMCREGYPLSDGNLCRACQGEAPYGEKISLAAPTLKAVQVDKAVGKKALHDMTEIIPGKKKGPLLLKDQKINIGDVCRLQQMGRMNVYIKEEFNDVGPKWIHEDEAASAFAGIMSGPGTRVSGPPREGKANIVSDQDGLFLVNENVLEAFNLVPDVMCASRHNHVLVKKETPLAGTRAIPLFLSRERFQAAMNILSNKPLFEVRALHPANTGIIITGSEIFQGLVEDKFIPIITSKVQTLGGRIIGSAIVPDEREMLIKNLRKFIESGADLIITTAGLSVDPDDITRQALIDAGAEDLLHGAPILPGAMTLLARIGNTRVLGVPACALYFKTTSLDLLLPRILAGIDITRTDLSKMGMGSFCLECRICSFPKCPFGK